MGADTYTIDKYPGLTELFATSTLTCIHVFHGVMLSNTPSLNVGMCFCFVRVYTDCTVSSGLLQLLEDNSCCHHVLFGANMCVNTYSPHVLH